jgi:hypothetical protein
MLIAIPNPVANNIGLDKKTGDPTFHIDIKSEELQEILAKVLQGGNSMSNFRAQQSTSNLSHAEKATFVNPPASFWSHFNACNGSGDWFQGDNSTPMHSQQCDWTAFYAASREL